MTTLLLYFPTLKLIVRSKPHDLLGVPWQLTPLVSGSEHPQNNQVLEGFYLRPVWQPHIFNVFMLIPNDQPIKNTSYI